MPFTHVEIEEHKSRNIALLFVFLVGIYAASLLALAWGIKAFLGADQLVRNSRGPARELVVISGLSLAFGAVHWLWSIRRLFERVLDAIGARPVDPRDTYHAKLTNLVEEVAVAMGGRPIEVYVIPTPAVNACAFSDFDRRAAIAVTEGALALLSRPQLESVVGHEAAHIASGDSLTTTIFCGLFALHEEALKSLADLFADKERGTVGGRAGAFIVFVYGILIVTSFLKTVCSMCISREKEYRADAVAVRLTRNPLSLAEALSLISRKWRGVTMRGESLSSLFIMDPGAEYFSESGGLLGDLFSTHPPTDRRIELLLGMAHLDASRFDDHMAAAISRRGKLRSQSPEPVERSAARWRVWRDGAWHGPLGLEELDSAGWLTPETWVQRVEEERTRPAHQDPQLLDVLRRRYAAPEAASFSALDCPRCRVRLVSVSYEGTPIERCPACRGCYVEPETIAKVFAREEQSIPEEVQRMGNMLLDTAGYVVARKRFEAVSRTPMRWSCPKCGAAVVKQFYTLAYPVEVEKCWVCGLAWLDHQELELLQYLYEKRRSAREGSDPLPGEETPLV